ncbi:glycosyltransferase [bacterium]|nr:glycosyltransferase [candidate division CSSED10-310 bacterium]
MKILQIVHHFPQTAGAGVENYTRQICDALSQTESVSVITRGSHLFSGPYGALFPLTGFPYPVMAFFRHPRDRSSPEQSYWDPGLEPAFREFITSWKPDIVHFQHAIDLSMSLVHTARSACRTVLFTLHDYWTQCPRIIRIDNRGAICLRDSEPAACQRCMTILYKAPRLFMSGPSFFRIRNRRMMEELQACQAILCPSQTVARTATSAGITPNRLLHWPFGIDHSNLPPRKATDMLPSDPIRFGYTGTFSHHKGLPVLLNAFSRLPDDVKNRSELHVFGGSPDSSTMSRWINRFRRRCSSSRIRFRGLYSRTDLVPIQNELDVIVVPSTWLENRPLTILEAFASGNPVIGSCLGGIQELLESSGAGWLFQPGDTETLIKIITSIVRRPEEIIEKRQRIPSVPNIDDECRNLLELYRRYLSVQ